MPTVQFRFYEELNDHLPIARRKCGFAHAFDGAPAIKDVIEALGVPHTEIDLILVDGKSVRFSHRLRGGERVAVYPMFERFDIRTLHRLRPKPLRRTRFVADVHLGKLARSLRLLGFDTLYSAQVDDAELVAISARDRRIVLTRDLGLPTDRLKVTIFKGEDGVPRDAEAHGFWLTHVRADRILELGAKENFWAMGDTGPCGPCSEIFYDHGPGIAGGAPGSAEEEGDRYVEIWNLVFTQYDRAPDGTLTPLPSRTSRAMRLTISANCRPHRARTG